MKKILVLAYAISPTRGSEYSVAWNYVSNMSIENELVVLFGTSANHMGEIDEIVQLSIKNPIKNVEFIPVLPNKLATILNLLNKKKLFVYSFYLAYTIWHKQAYKIAKELTNKERFDLVHFVGPIGYREPGYLWKLNLPYIWGPIGGTNNLSLKMLPALNFRGILKLGFRTIANTIQLHFKYRIKNAIKACDVLLTATTENKYIVDRVFKVNSIYLPENGITTTINLKEKKTDIDKIRLIWIGSIDERKALITLLRALSQVKDLEKVELHVVGDGPLKLKLKAFCKLNKIDKSIIWHGSVSRERVFEILRDSDLHIITSLSEGNPTTVWETLSLGIPTLTIDHCGMRDTITDGCGIKIPLSSYNQVIHDIAFSLNKIINKEIDIYLLSKGATERASIYTWTKRIEFFEQMYDLAISQYKLKRR